MQIDESHWNEKIVKTYVHHSEMQRRWAMSFLAKYLQSLKGGERILDIGCGDGRITADISQFVPRGFVCGVDPSDAMLNWAQKQYHPSEYPNLSFEKGGFLNIGVKGNFNLVISCCAFQQCQDKTKGISNIARLIEPNGKLLMMFPGAYNTAWNMAVKDIQSSSKWSKYWTNNSSRTQISLTSQEYVQMLESNGFHSIRIEENHTADPFIDRDELIDMWLGVYPSIIPLDFERQFFHDVIDEYLKIQPNGMTSSGVIYLQCGYVAIVAEKQ